MNLQPDPEKSTITGTPAAVPPPARPAHALDAIANETDIRMTLEQLVDLTGELAHLNELVMMHVNEGGGFTTPENYFRTVQPVLDDLEREIRIRYRPGMDTAALKRIVQDWIDHEIAARNCDSSR